MKYLSGVVLIVSLGAAQASGELTVIYDSGKTSSIRAYLPDIKPVINNKRNSSQEQSPFTLPITTPSMQPGTVTVEPKKLHYLQRPLFLVGADAFSQRWLFNKRDQLKRIGAVGLLIQAKDMAEVETILQLADGLQLIPASAEGFAKQVGLSHYPVLLSKEGWEQ
jgi:integrating conjugative element protein (TIGR03765 family)